MEDLGPGGTGRFSVGLYSALLVVTLVLIGAVHNRGQSLVAPLPAVPAAAVEAGGSAQNVMVHVLFALAVVIVVGHLFGRLLAAIGQPAVIGEVIGGIVVGPSVLGRLSPDAVAFIIPAAAAPILGVISQLGVALYMFLVGLSLDTNRLRRKVHAAVAISNAGIATPFVLGSLLALYLFPRYGTANVTFTSFALFIAVAMSITAFPVLARILTDHRMHRTEIGALALTCAAADDVTAWCLLAIVVGIVRAAVSDALVVAMLAAVYVAAMFLVVRPIARRSTINLNDASITRGAVAITLVSLLASMLITEAIGIHQIFGAFLLGAVIPHDSALARAMSNRMEDLVTILLLPAFFALTGLRTEIGLVSGAAAWVTVLFIIVVATAGKFGGAAVAARLSGLTWRESAVLGALMNTRGLMELVVLNIGLELGVISTTLFTMMVLMALATTLMATPLMRLADSFGQERSAPPGAAFAKSRD